MGQAEERPSEKVSGKKEMLVQAVEKLIDRSQEERPFGVSQQFVDQVSSPEEAMELCHQAMEALATTYLEHLTAFQQKVPSLEALKELELAEQIWQQSSSIINRFDASGTEQEFLKTLRIETLSILEDQLEDASRELYRQPSSELTACVLGIIGTMDKALTEIGHPKESKSRKRLTSIAEQLCR
ncbi:MAG: hypothetical protein K0S07_623 [Chlamydiales bacterium]|jgi:hypothetical protein|nr:hypothetical protein [Chlamydiales bacterium]